MTRNALNGEGGCAGAPRPADKGGPYPPVMTHQIRHMAESLTTFVLPQIACVLEHVFPVYRAGVRRVAVKPECLFSLY